VDGRLDGGGPNGVDRSRIRPPNSGAGLGALPADGILADHDAPTPPGIDTAEAQFDAGGPDPVPPTRLTGPTAGPGGRPGRGPVARDDGPERPPFGRDKRPGERRREPPGERHGEDRREGPGAGRAMPGARPSGDAAARILASTGDAADFFTGEYAAISDRGRPRDGGGRDRAPAARSTPAGPAAVPGGREPFDRGRARPGDATPVAPGKSANPGSSGDPSGRRSAARPSRPARPGEDAPGREPGWQPSGGAGLADLALESVAPGPDTGSRRSGRDRRRTHPALRVVGALVLIGVLVVGFSVGHALAVPGSDTARSRLGDWARGHSLGFVVTGLHKVI
jgi:hypothetical protein